MVTAVKVALPGPKRGSTGGESARLNIGLKSAETPVISGLQALVSDISTGSLEPVENHLSRHLKVLVSLHQDCFCQCILRWHCLAPTAGQGGTAWYQPGVNVALPGPNRSQGGTPSAPPAPPLTPHKQHKKAASHRLLIRLETAVNY